MLKDVAVNPKSKILSEPWLAKLNTEVIDDAIQYLAKCEPDSFQILEQKMPELVKKCPSLSVLEKTPTLSKVRKVGDFSDKIAKMFNSKTKLSNFGKIGLCITGVAMLSAGAVSIFNQDKKEVLSAKNNELSQKTGIYTKPLLTNSSCLTI